jgi:hypothetical protein
MPRDAVRAGGVQAPLEDVPVDDHCPGQVAVPAALLDGSGVDDECSRRVLGGEVGGLDAVEAEAGGGEQDVDGAGFHARTVCRA